METSINVVVTMLLGVTAFLILAFMATSFVNGSEQTLVGWLP